MSLTNLTAPECKSEVKPKNDIRLGLVDSLKAEFPELENADKVDVHFLYGASDKRGRFRINAWREVSDLWEIYFSQFVIAWKDGENIFYELR